MTTPLSRDAVRIGAVRGRYFRENFAQGGIELVQIIPELVTNADAAIAAAGRPHGRIELAFGAPDQEFLAAWRAQMRALRAPALLRWRFEVRCTDDGIGVDAAAVDRRLGALGELPERGGQRGLFGRGLRDVWLAQGAGRIEGVRDGRTVESWFFPAADDDPYAYLHVREGSAPGAASGTRVTVPLAIERLPADGRLRTLVSQLVQLRPVLKTQRGRSGSSCRPVPWRWCGCRCPSPIRSGRSCSEDQVRISGDASARVTVRRSPSRSLRACRAQPD